MRPLAKKSLPIRFRIYLKAEAAPELKSQYSNQNFKEMQTQFTQSETDLAADLTKKIMEKSIASPQDYLYENVASQGLALQRLKANRITITVEKKEAFAAFSDSETGSMLFFDGVFSPEKNIKHLAAFMTHGIEHLLLFNHIKAQHFHTYAG